jgi:hypothetical protein
MTSRCAMRAPSDRHGVARRLSSALGLAAMVLGADGARAGEVGPFICHTVCAPLPSTQLEGYRAQGLNAAPSGDMKLGVILWDEYRRVRVPTDGGDAPGARVSYAPTMTTAR